MDKAFKIDEKSVVEVNGESYYLRIRSQNPASPVVLFLHGGPGSADRPLIMHHLSVLAEVCTIVAWDQRGAGLAYRGNETLTKQVYLQDAYRLITYLCDRFHQSRVILVGHSFGSQFGVWVCDRYPELIDKYVGIGQFIDSIRNEELSFQFVMKEAERRNDKRAIKKMKRIGPPVNGFYKNDKVLTQRNYLHKFGGAKYGSKDTLIAENLKLASIYLKEYSIVEMVRYFKGASLLLASPLAQDRENFIATVKKLSVPVYLLLGHHDYNCPYSLAEEWFNGLEAPFKKLIWFEKSAHSPQFEESERWCYLFKKEVLGL